MQIFIKSIHALSRIPLHSKLRIGGLLVVLLLFTVCIGITTVFFSTRFPLLLGLTILAYGLGLRHAVDADHIAAIDNTTRKFMQEGKKPVFIGFFFSLGHSTVVIALSLALAFSASFIKETLPAFEQVGVVIGTTISSFFLLLIGIINLVFLIEIFHTFLHVVKTKSTLAVTAHTHIHTAGFFMKLFKPLVRVVSKEWHMYFLGLLFGLGFDTASEVALLSISATSGSSGLPLSAILLLPLAFTAGMALVDSLDGILMLGAYGWAFIKPVRKLYYNLTITLLSVAIAFFIGGIEAVQVISTSFHLHGSFFAFMNGISLNNLGFIIIFAFICSWIISLVIYKLKNYDHLNL